MLCESAVPAVTSEDLLPSVCQALPLCGVSAVAVLLDTWKLSYVMQTFFYDIFPLYDLNRTLYC
jgi:hypothetical protein